MINKEISRHIDSDVEGAIGNTQQLIQYAMEMSNKIEGEPETMLNHANLRLEYIKNNYKLVKK